MKMEPNIYYPPFEKETRSERYSQYFLLVAASIGGLIAIGVCLFAVAAMYDIGLFDWLVK